MTLVDELSVKLSLTYADFLAGLRAIESQTDSVESEMKMMEVETGKVDDKFDKLGDSSKEAADKIRNTTDAINEEAKASEEASENIDKHTKSSKDAADADFDFSSAVSKVTSAFTAAGLISATVEAAKYLENLRVESYETARRFEILYDDVTLAAQALYDYREAKLSLEGVDENQALGISEQLNKEFGLSASYGYGKTLAQGVVDITDVTGYNSQRMIADIAKIINDYGLNESQALGYLQQILAVSQQQEGITSENFASTINALTQYDTMYNEMGYTFDEILGIFAATGEQFKTSMDVSSAFYKEWLSAQSMLAKGETESVSELKLKDADIIKSKTDNTLKTIVENDAKVIGDEIGKSAGQMVREIIESGLIQGGESYSKLTGKDKYELVDIAQAASNYRDYIPEAGSNTVRLYEKDAVQMFVDNNERFVNKITDKLFPTELTKEHNKQVSKSLDDLLEELKQIRPDLANSLKSERELLDGIGIMRGRSDEELLEVVSKYLDNNGKQNVTINQNFYSPTADSYTVKNAAQQAMNASQSRGMKLV